MCEQQGSSGRGVGQGCRGSSRRQGGRAACMGLPRQLCHSHHSWPWGLQGQLYPQCFVGWCSPPFHAPLFFEIIWFPHNAVEQYWSSGGGVFSQRGNLWDSFWVLNNLYHYQSSIKKGLWYRLLTYFWYLFLQNDLFFSLKFYSIYSNYSQSIALEMKIKMDDDNNKRRYGIPNFHKVKRVNFLVISKRRISPLLF